MDLLKNALGDKGTEAIQDKVEDAVRDAMIDNVTKSVSQTLGVQDSPYVGKVSGLVKKALDDDPKPSGDNKQAEYKEDFIDKGIDIVQTKILKIEEDDARDRKIATVIREGIATFKDKDGQTTTIATKTEESKPVN